MAKTNMTQIDGTSHLKIDTVVDSGQLLVTLSRNGKEWLSPVGWVRKEKGTLLDCQSSKDHTIVEIPAEFAKQIQKGDKIELNSKEIKYSGSLTWGEAPAVPVKPVKKPNGVAPMEALSLEESEKRAKQAEKTAAEFRAQMEEAAKAREAAQTAALEAARKADEALKAEADRIAEMEKAAKAFEDAERKRMEEQRRLERERRLEEERKAEEARIAEEARMKAEAERLKKERSEARKFFKGQISETKAEKSRLQEVLDGFKAKAEATEADLEDSAKRLARMEKSVSTAQKDEAENKAALSREENRVSELKTSKNKIMAAIGDLDKGNEKVFKSLKAAETAHEKALREVEAAKMRAAEALQNLTSIRTQTDKVNARKETLKLEAKDTDAKLSVSEKHLNGLKLSFDKARLTSEKEQTGLKEVRKSREELDQKLTSAKTDVSRTLQDIRSVDDTLKRQQNSLKQIEDMENADDIRKMAGSAPVPTSKKAAVSSTPVIAAKAAKGAEEKGGFLSRFFSRSGQDKSVVTGETKTKQAPKAEIRVEKTTHAAKEITHPVSVKPAAPHTKNGQGVRLNSWLIMGLAATSAIALGAAFAVNGSGEAKPLATLAPTPDADLAPSADDRVQLADASSRQTTRLSTSSLDLAPAQTATAETPKPVPKQEVMPSKEVTPSPETKTVDTERSSSAPAKTRRTQKRSTAPTPKPRPEQAYADVNRQVQEQLNYLGFYSGPIDGQQTRETQKAMQEFKAVYDLPQNNTLSSAFINTLKRAYDENVELRSAEYIALENTPVVQVAENTAVTTYVPAPTSTAIGIKFFEPASIESQLMEAANTQMGIASGTSEPRLTQATRSGETQMAELSIPATSLVKKPAEDVVVPAKVTRKAKVEYPAKLLRKQRFYDAKVYVTYDVNTDGEAINPRVASVDYDGPENYQAQFERAAIKAVKTQRFSARTVNGEQALERDRTTRISFTISE